jgi:hypothetical protein
MVLGLYDQRRAAGDTHHRARELWPTRTPPLGTGRGGRAEERYWGTPSNERMGAVRDFFLGGSLPPWVSPFRSSQQPPRMNSIGYSIA